MKFRSKRLAIACVCVLLAAGFLYFLLKITIIASIETNTSDDDIDSLFVNSERTELGTSNDDKVKHLGFPNRSDNVNDDTFRPASDAEDKKGRERIESAKNNVSGVNGTPHFMGEDRFFPDQATRGEIDRLLATVKTHLDVEMAHLSYLDNGAFKWNVGSHTQGKSLSAFQNLDSHSLTAWERFHKGIHQHALYDPDSDALPQILNNMATLDITRAKEFLHGTQLKLILTLRDQSKVLFKPQRLALDSEGSPDLYHFLIFERHNAEIAAFHLDRLMGFYRVPPAVGRTLNLSEELFPVVDKTLAKTFYLSPVNNLCFHGNCDAYCDATNAICGHPDMVNGSLAVLLPSGTLAARKVWRNPWKRAYSKHRKAVWQVYDDYCDGVREKDVYRNGRRLLDMIDMAIFDFLIDNMDRHHYETFEEFGNETFILHLDQGRGFSQSSHDEMSILAPLYQCCQIRQSTLLKLLRFATGPGPLSAALRRLLDQDPIRPLLNSAHLYALDRRLHKALSTLSKCMQERTEINIQTIIVDDGF